MRRPSAVIIALSLAVLVHGSHAEEDERPWDEQPYLGISVRDSDSGLVVGWVRPGPLGGQGFESTSGLMRGDNLVSVDGQVVDAAGFKALLSKKAPGDSVVLVYRRSNDATAEGAVPKGGAGGEERTLEVALGTRAQWAGTIGRGLGHRTIPEATEGAFEAAILEQAGLVGIRDGEADVGGGLDALLPYLRRIQEDALDPNSLPAVVQALRRPLSVDAVEAVIADSAREAIGGERAALESLIATVLDLPDPSQTIDEILGREEDAPSLSAPEIRSLVRFAGQHLQEYQGERTWRASAERLVRTLRESVYIFDEHAESHVETISTIAGSRVESLLALPMSLLRLAPEAWEAQASSVADGTVLAEVPESVRAAVTGDLLWVGADALGHLAVVGGPGANTYDMAKVAAVYDVGGDDAYTYGTPDSPVGLRLIVDLAGNDRHVSEADFEGPGTAVFGLSYLDDRAGDDVYRTKGTFGIGAGLFGVGVLLDRAGHDVYENTGEASGWAMGVGFYGAGLVVDLDGQDVYRGEKLVQGVGGPRGFGAILDVKGRDVYHANGPSFGSAYGTPAVYLGMSQGFGIGVRGYAAGGVGAIYDFAGDDRYEGGEFSQGGGYYFGLGILHDVGGNDLYYGNRYGQAFAAHQAVGILVDDAGNDTYWSVSIANQAGTWDQSVGLLLDRAGNDAYRCTGLGQGGASMQAIALLIDLAGNDVYAGRGSAVQGQGGGNRYHYDADRVFSFSALLDRGGGTDTYSATGRANDTVLRTGAWKEENPAASDLHGLFLDD